MRYVERVIPQALQFLCLHCEHLTAVSITIRQEQTKTIFQGFYCPSCGATFRLEVTMTSAPVTPGTRATQRQKEHGKETHSPRAQNFLMSTQPQKGEKTP